MTTARFIAPETIEQLASAISRDAGLDSAEPGAIDAVTLAKFFGCTVEEVDFNPKDISARIYRGQEKSECVIQISKSDNAKRQRFSIAHEVAHLVLHAEDDKDNEFLEWRKPLSDYDAPDKLFKEVQANMLASALLMPKKLVESAWKESRDIEDLASLFNVSRSAAYYRVENLDLLRGE